MHEEWLNGKSANEIINSSKQPERIDANVDQSKYDGTDWKWNITVWPRNANLNYYQYWDDSNPNQQWQKGWMNQKYTWEWVSNTYIEYNPDLTLADLDPNYLYWENARQQNRKEAWYIARRNDMIASALYNEWKVSREDVANFLSQQNEWMNSTEADRMNTIESVWKRLWQIKPEEKIEEEPQTDFTKDTSGKIYGKTTAEEWNPKQWIDTLSDDNSVFNAINATRVKTTDEMYNVWVDNLAATKYYNTWAYSEQNWRDFSLRYPETAALVEQKVKEMKAQDTVNAVSNGTDLPSNTNTVWAVNNNIADFSNANATSTTSSAQITKNINTMLDNNQTAQTAQELMWTLEWEMATLKNRLKNLREEANSKFKWDAPDYLVNAYMNNKSQEIQNQLSILEDRYNAAYKRYTTEVSQAQWQQEFDLKKDQLALQEKTYELNKWATEQWIAIDWYKATNSTTTTSNSWRELPVTTKTRDEIWWIVDNLVDMVNNWKVWNAQCATWIQRYYFPELWISIWWLSTFEAKKWLINTDEYYVPKKWDLVIIDSGAKLEDWTNAWHIWIVVSVDWDTLTYLDWNGDWKETAKVRTTSINNKKIAWYYDVTRWQPWTSWYIFSQEDIDMFDDYIHNKLDKDEVAILTKKFWVDEQQLTSLAYEVLYWDETNKDDESDISSEKNTIEIPDSVYIVDDWYSERRADPNSEEWKKLAQDYIDGKVWISSKWTSWNQTTTDLWFDESMVSEFEAIKANKKTIAEVAKWRSMSKWRVEKMYNNYLNAVKNWYDWLKEWEIKSTYAYDILEKFAELYSIVDDNENWKVNFSLRPRTNSYAKWNQIRSMLTLDAMLKAKESDVWFWQVTEYEWEMLRASASAINNAWKWRDSKLDDEFEEMIRLLWSKAYWKDAKFDKDEWMDFRRKIKKTNSWNKSVEEQVKNSAADWLKSWETSDTNDSTWVNYVEDYNIIW